MQCVERITTLENAQGDIVDFKFDFRDEEISPTQVFSRAIDDNTLYDSSQYNEGMVIDLSYFYSCLVGLRVG
jgi:hypothetical protein